MQLHWVASALTLSTDGDQRLIDVNNHLIGGSDVSVMILLPSGRSHSQAQVWHNSASLFKKCFFLLLWVESCFYPLHRFISHSHHMNAYVFSFFECFSSFCFGHESIYSVELSHIPASISVLSAVATKIPFYLGGLPCSRVRVHVNTGASHSKLLHAGLRIDGERESKNSSVAIPIGMFWCKKKKKMKVKSRVDN